MNKANNTGEWRGKHLKEPVDGWSFPPDFLREMTHAINEESNESIEIEELEVVLLHLLKLESPSTETGQPTYTLDQIRQAGKEGEVNHLDVEHIIDLLKEGSDKSTEKGQQGVEEQAEWEFLTIIRTNRAILKNADGKVAFPNHSAKSAALEVYDDMIEIISHLPAKRSGKEKQVADYVNNLSQPQVGQDELWDELREDIYRHRKTFKECSSKFTLIKK